MVVKVIKTETLYRSIFLYKNSIDPGTPKVPGQVLMDRTESRLVLLKILPAKYKLSILIRLGPWTQIWRQKFLDQIDKQKKNLEKKKIGKKFH
jgi:hypothetical protein